MRQQPSNGAAAGYQIVIIALQLGHLLLDVEPESRLNRRGQILKYMQDNMQDPISLESLASHVALPPSRTRHLVRQLFEVTFSTLARSIKIRQAAYYLSTTDLRVGEVAALTGYHDQNYFTRIFSKTLKQTPLHYREYYRSNLDTLRSHPWRLQRKRQATI